MDVLSPHDIREVDERIDAAVPSQSLLARDRDVALIHLLRCYDEYAKGCASILNAGQRETATHLAYEGLHHAVRWVHQYCPHPASTPSLGYEEGAFKEAEELLHSAREYSKIWEIMTLLHRGVLMGQQVREGLIRVSFTSSLDRQMSIADNLLAGPDVPEVYFNEPIITPPIQASVIRNVQVRKNTPKAFKYLVPDALFNQLSRRVNRMTAHRWALDPGWDLGGYTAGQLRRFWDALDTLCLIHGIVTSGRAGVRNMREFALKTLTRTEWEQELTRRTGLGRKIVAAILSDLTYAPSLYEAGRKQAHVTFHPAFPFGGNTLAVSNWLVHVSNIERNIWDLVSLKRPELHSRLRNLKEESWLSELRVKAESYGLDFYPPVKFEVSGKKSDLDMLLLDRKARFGLACQLKWLTMPGRIAAALYNDKEVEKGIEQARLAMEWIALLPQRLSQYTGLSTDELRLYEFRPVVLCKNTLPSGISPMSGVPVVNERLFDWVLGDPHRRDLKTLWQVGEKLLYLPQPGKHFDSVAGTVEFGRIRFTGDALGHVLREKWDPVKDINLRAITEA
jgi:hypothetical protein